MADWTGSRLPVFFEAPEQQPDHRPLAVDADTTPRQLVLHTMFGNPSRTLPAGLLIIGHQVGEALVPVVMGLAIDRAIQTGDWAATIRWVLVLAALFAFLFVVALVDGLGLLAGLDVQGGQRPRHGRDRLHRGPHPEHLAVGHAAFEAACAIGEAGNALCGTHHFIVSSGAAPTSLCEAITDFHSLSCASSSHGASDMVPSIR